MRQTSILVLAGAAWIAASGPVAAGTAAAPAPTPAIAGTGGESAYLGVRLREETQLPEGGARVTEVIAGSPADEAGIAEGDVIVGFDGEVIRGPVALSEKIRARAPGESVPIVVVRDGQSVTLRATLGEREGYFELPPLHDRGALHQLLLQGGEERREAEEGIRERLEQLGRRHSRQQGAPRSPHVAPWSLLVWGRPKLGVQLVETTPELRRHLGGDEDSGVLVSKVFPGTPAAESGFAVGDLILSVDGRTVATADELVEALQDKAGKSFPIAVVRDRQRITIQVTIPESDESHGPRACRRVPRCAPRASV